MTRTSRVAPIPADADRWALWVWEAEVVTDDIAKARFFDFVRREHINAIYLYAHGLVTSPSTVLASFVVQAGEADVELLAGDPSWALASNHNKALSFVESAIAFSQDVDEAGRPVGLHLDIEPYLLEEWNSDREHTIKQYLDLLMTVKEKLGEAKHRFILNADIPFWYDTIEATYNGEIKLLQQHVQDIVDGVVIMDYRDEAGGSDGIIAHAQDELDYAKEIGKLVTIGIETNCIEPAKITFCQEGKAVMEQELAEARRAFQENPAFHGFAVHDYAGYVKLSQALPTPTPTTTQPPMPTYTPMLPSPTYTVTRDYTPTPTLTATPTQAPTSTAEKPSPMPTPTCPPANAEGTVPPAVAIQSVTFLVNGVQQVVTDVGGSLKASPGADVWVKQVRICTVAPVEGDGGVVYVEFDPVDETGQVMASEVTGTRAVGATSGFISVPGPDHAWIIGEHWRHISIATVHYPRSGRTQNADCEGGLCEVDDRVIVPIE